MMDDGGDDGSWASLTFLLLLLSLLPFFSPVWDE